MLTVGVLSNRLGLSIWQTRRLIYALKPVLQGLLKSKPGQPLEVSPQAIGILERAAQLRGSGIPLSGLAAIVQDELGENGNEHGDGQPKLQTLALEHANPPQGLISELRARITDLQTQIEELRRDKLYLQEQLARALEQLEDLQRRALPPARRWRWPWARRRGEPR